MRPRRRTSVLVAVLAAAAVAPGSVRSAEGRTRSPALAGSWYPGDRARLVAAAHLLLRLSAEAPALPDRPVALVVPHAGWSYSGLAAAAAFRSLRPGDFDRVVVVAPSHHGSFRGYALDDAKLYRTPIGEVPLCAGASAPLRGPLARVVRGVARKEHGVEVELPFLQAALGRFCLVPVLVGDTDESLERAFAERLAALDDGRTLFVFSSDFAHYGPRYEFQPFGALSTAVTQRIRAMDEQGVALLAGLDARGFRDYLAETGNTICGRHGLATLLELLARVAPRARAVPLAHYASSDLPGVGEPSSVTYVSIAFLREAMAGAAFGPPLVAPPRLVDAPQDAPALSPEEGRHLVRLARAALTTHFFERDDLGRELAAWPAGRGREERRAVFVTLNRTDPDEVRAMGRLRGCTGQAEPTFPLYYGTVQAALEAALRDRRFEPVSAFDLSRLEVEVTVLSRPTPVASWRDIRLGTHGIALRKGSKAALFLPQAAAELNLALEPTLDALAKKAGLTRGAWREGARLSVFTGQVFAERP
jgi:AmmeMemoRadiSam system protein B/AmmeMemoRadiSam system protein A